MAGHVPVIGGRANGRACGRGRGRGHARRGQGGAGQDGVGQRGVGRGRARGRGGPPDDESQCVEPGRQPVLRPFANAGSTGPKLGPGLDHFKLFFQIVVDETNRYATQYQAREMPDGGWTPRARVRSWKPVTMKKMKQFMGLNIMTGIVKKPEVVMYWSTDEIQSTPYFAKIMKRDEYQVISRFLHFNNNESRPADCQDKLFKVRPIYDHLLDGFKSLYSPGEYIAIDEGTLCWKGRLSFRVYNPLKPIKYGIKSYILADSRSGYCWNLIIYEGTHRFV